MCRAQKKKQTKKNRLSVIAASSRHSRCSFFFVHEAKIHACHQCLGIKTEQNEAHGPDTCLAVREHQRNALSGMRAGEVGVFVWGKMSRMSEQGLT